MKGEYVMIDKVPTLKELLSNRKESHANSIIVSTNRNKDLFDFGSPAQRYTGYTLLDQQRTRFC